MEKNFLLNKVVKLKPIPERYNPNYLNIDAKHVGRFRFPNCSANIMLRLDEGSKGLKRILTEEEQAFFEQKLNMLPGTLSFYRKGTDPKDYLTYNFWYGFIVRISSEEELTLDLSDPMDNLRWRVLKVDRDVAPSWEERTDKPSYKWALVDENYEIVVTTNSGEIRTKAYVEYSKIMNNKPKMLVILKSMGKGFTNETNVAVLQNEILNIIERPKSDFGLNINDFLSAIEDSHGETKAFITDALSAKEIVKYKNVYKLKSGDEIARSYEELIDWVEDISNQEIKKTIELKIKQNEV